MDTSPIRVLHVDDDPSHLELTGEFLKREDDRFTLETATGADEGLNQIADRPPDCIVSDYDMPNKNGIEFLQAVRKTHPDLPFILFTGKGSEDIASDAISVGVTDYLQKEPGTEQYELLANRIANAVEQQWAEQQLQEERQRFQTLFDRLSQPTVEVHYEAGVPIIERVNPAFENVFGYDAATLIGDSLDTHIVPDDRSDEAEVINQHVQTGGQIKSKEVIRQTTDGTRKFLLQNAVYEDGSGGFAIYTDVTERSERTEALERSQELLQHTEQLADTGGWEADVGTGEQRWTHGTYTIHDLDPYGTFQPTVKTALEFYHPDDRSTIETAVENCRDHGEPYELELRLITAEDEQRWVRTNGEPVYEDDTLVKIRGAIRDITAQKERQQELRRYERLVTYSPELLVIMDEQMTVTYQSPPSPLFEWEPLEVGGEAPLEYIHPDDRDAVLDLFRRVKQQPDQISTAEFRAKDAHGEWRWVESRAQNFADTDEINGILAAMREITQRKQQEQQLARYNTLLEQLQSTTQELLKTTDLETAAQQVVESFDTVLEFDIAGVWVSTEDQQALEPVAVSEHGQAVIPDPPVYTSDTQSLSWKAYQDQEVRYISDISANDQRVNAETPIESEVIAPLGRHGVLNVGATEPDAFTKQEVDLIDLWSDTVTIVFGRIAQVELLQEREAELTRQRDRLDEFTRVVSHDLRSPLSVAKGRAELAATECDSEHLTDITQALTRMESLLEDSLELAQQGRVVGETTTVDLEEFVPQVWQGVSTEGASLNIDTVPTIQADTDRLPEVFENLFRNAVEHGGESVTISVGRIADGIYVSDDGPGIASDEQSQVFESGYTTSDDGSGFGLAIVRQICEAHGWEIDVTKSAAGGARFEITNIDLVH